MWCKFLIPSLSKSLPIPRATGEDEGLAKATASLPLASDDVFDSYRSSLSLRFSSFWAPEDGDVAGKNPLVPGLWDPVELKCFVGLDEDDTGDKVG